MKISFKNLNFDYKVLAGLQTVILAFLLLNCKVHSMSFLDGVKVFLYQLFAWFLAGTCIVDVLKIKTKDLCENIALSYAFGGILSLLIYMVFMLSGLKNVMPYITALEAVSAIIYLIKIRNPLKNAKSDYHGIILCFSILIFYFLMTTVIVSFVNTIPNELTYGNGYYVDWPFWVGNNITLTKQFPAFNFRQVGIPLRYHYFSSILMAQVSLCTGTDIVKISFYFSSFLFGVFLIFSAYYFSARILKSKWTITLIMIALLFTDGDSVSFAWHTNICPFGFDIGYAYGMVALGILAEILRNDRFKELFVPSVILIAMTTGTKGPVGAIVLVAYGVASIYYLLSGKIKRGILSGTIWAGTFLLILLGFIKGNTTFSSEVGLTYIGGLDIDTIVEDAEPITKIYNTIIEDYCLAGRYLIVKLYAVWLYIFRINNILIILLLLSLAAAGIKIWRRQIDITLYALIAASLIGIFCGIYFVQQGGSQMYFLMAIYPTAGLAGMYSVELLDEISKGSKKRRAIFQSVCAVLFIFLGISASWYYKVARSEFVLGLNVIRNKLTYESCSPHYCDAADYEAFAWLKENTDEDCVFAIDEHLDIYNIDNSMLAGIFSQRYLWNETKYSPQAEAERRDGIVGSLSVDTEKALQTMKSEGVEYLMMQIRDGKTEYGSQTDMLTEVFRNDHYIIYKL